ncbi:LPXTG cell wall anchor domain-containing protein [Pleurocapsales cyanobacterium LEGE 10410]|nr:LPXTG cell wall anchor domain-containing protein [Pleurocapsales cyanobacterium LEGE 10410]
MAYQTTAGWSLISSGLTTLFLKIIPGDSLWWGILLLALGGVVLFVRKKDVAKS